MHTARHDSSYPPQRDGICFCDRKYCREGVFMVSKRIQLPLSLEKWWELSWIFWVKPSQTSCQSQVNNSVLWKFQSPNPSQRCIVTQWHAYFWCLFPWKRAFPSPLKMRCHSLQLAGTHTRPLLQKSTCVLIWRSCVFPHSLCFSLSSALTGFWWNNGGVGHAITNLVETTQIDGIAG